MVNGSVHTNLFLQLMEFEVIDLSLKKYNKLSIPDGDKLRQKLREILVKYDILIENIEKPVQNNEYNHNFSKKDVEWLDKQKAAQYAGLNNNFKRMK